MKYTEKELNRLKTLKETARSTYRVFMNGETPDSDGYFERKRFLKNKKKEAKSQYYIYKNKYKKYKSTKEKIKKLRKELKYNDALIDSEEDIKQTCIDNIVVETMHNSYDDFLLKAISAYTKEQPVRFNSVAPYVLAYEHSTKLMNIHKACVQIAARKLDILNIELASI
tara:strand:- start:143 stop:649 length:507 start_codon:yes stop_codon:yes gene_type:complete